MRLLALLACLAAARSVTATSAKGTGYDIIILAGQVRGRGGGGKGGGEEGRLAGGALQRGGKEA